MDYISAISTQFDVKAEYVKNILSLLDEGNTIPFIARYRKEMHGSLDDQKIRELAERYDYLQRFDKRREEVRAAIEAAGKLTDELNAALDAAATLAEVEDIYLPYKKKKRTRASVAREKGLEPLAAAIFAQESGCAWPIDMAEAYVDAEKGVETAQDALKGALDIIAEDISDNANIRKRLRYVVYANGVLRVKAADPKAESVYTNYYDYSEPLSKMAGHRLLAVNRGEKEGFLKASIDFDTAKGMAIVCSECMTNYDSPCADAVMEAAQDSYDRLIFPSISNEVRGDVTDTACEASLKVFSQNLHQLLMQPPVKGRTVIGLDPGYRTGCKVACVDGTGRVLDTGVVYLTHSDRQKEDAKKLISNMIRRYGVTVISIGNGTASKETEIFVADLLPQFPEVSYMVVSEAGASVYSASKLAAEEFPDFDLTLRSAISIARRLQDPLAELVKIDPKSIGVGQYQHDMNQKRLGESLGGVVENCVNSVGVDLNTASPSLLSYVAGITPVISKNIVAYREENGAFTSRRQLLKVAKLGPKAFEQCAGFMRIAESKNVLDNTAVHPESYDAAEKLLEMCGFTLADVRGGKLVGLAEKLDALGREKVAGELGVGVPTLNDIATELQRPGRDPRDSLPKPLLRRELMSLSDLQPGMELTGTVRNVIDFGAFVDIGVHEDGLVHISQISKARVKHPSDVLKVGDIVKVWVLSVDEKKGRISLTMKGAPNPDDNNGKKDNVGKQKRA